MHGNKESLEASFALCVVFCKGETSQVEYAVQGDPLHS